MVNYCVCAGCTNSNLSGHRAHSFPNRKKSGALFRAWVRFVQVKRLDFTSASVTQNAVVCGAHFKSEDYDPSHVMEFRMGCRCQERNSDHTIVCCAAFGCTDRSERGHQMYGFPKDMARRKRLAMVSREHFELKGDYNSRKICQVHFEDDLFTNTKKGGLKLRPDAVPTLFIHRPKPRSRKVPTRSMDSAGVNEWSQDHTYCKDHTYCRTSYLDLEEPAPTRIKQEEPELTRVKEEEPELELTPRIKEEEPELELTPRIKEEEPELELTPRIKEEEPELELTRIREEEPELTPRIKEEEPELELTPRIKEEELELELTRIREEEPELELTPRIKEEEPELELTRIREEEPELELTRIREEEPELELTPRIKEEEPELELTPRIKEEEPEVELTPQIKEEEEELCIRPEEEQLVLKQETDTTVQFKSEAAGTLNDGENDATRYQEETDQHQLLALYIKNHVRDLPPQHVCKEGEVLSDQQDQNSGLDQAEPELPQMEEEQEELSSRLEEPEQLVLKRETDLPSCQKKDLSGAEPNADRLHSQNPQNSQNSPLTESQSQERIKNLDSTPRVETGPNKSHPRTRTEGGNGQRLTKARGRRKSVRCDF
ncbi:apical junction molecule-like isoform X2 [Cololabis saira]|uniref:apical junction molecule-like isoform X2 n=1 Tax=Cololabis saira TaxID=129043 RepID=UPI002AD57E59|nr:apical junction molecule-like isoform X2 [Cololabis saira]